MTRRHSTLWLTLAAVLSTAALPLSAGHCAVVSDMAVEPGEAGTCIRLTTDGPVQYSDFSLTDPFRIVVDCYDTVRQAATDAVAGPAGTGIREVRLSQYERTPRNITRAVVELDHEATYRVQPVEGGLLVIVDAAVPAAEAPTPLGAAGSPAVAAETQPATVPPAREDTEDLVTMDYQNAEIRTVIRGFSEYADVNIIAGPEVKGLVTVHLVDVPWREGLEIVLRANGFSLVDDRGVLRVGSSETMENEEIKHQAADRKKEELLPLETRVLHVSFADAEELLVPLRKMLSGRGSIEGEARTNSILVTDIAKNVDKIEELIQELDTRTPQVQINAKLVDMDASVSRDLGIEWEAVELKTPSVKAEGQASVSAGVGQPVGQFTVGKIKGPNGILDVTLSALEKENKASIISNPRITTLDNMEARILVGKKIPLIVSDEAGNPITQLTTIGIQMTVTPHINADGEITMDLHPEVSDLAAAATVNGGIIIVTSEAKTRVMVRNGETVVIGGLIRNNETESVSGVPLLRSLPLIGRLFRSTAKSVEQRELLIFVTPTIVS